MPFINCESIAKSKIEELKSIVSKMSCPPILNIIQVVGDQASNVYVRNKLKAAREIGIDALHFCLSPEISRKTVSELINGLSGGIIIQLPVPKHLEGIEKEIPPNQDVDGLTIENVGRLMSGDESGMIPCTAKGISWLLDRFDVAGKRVTIVGRSNLVGKPLIPLLLHRNATITVCHSKTQDLRGIIVESDIVISAIGKPYFFDKHWFAEGTIVIDVGINRNPENGKICGDVNPNVAETCNLTPVPKGVGLLTVAALMDNTMRV